VFWAKRSGRQLAAPPNRGKLRTATSGLKQDGGKLTGIVPGMMGRGNSVSFEVKREFNANTMVTKYEGTLAGEELKLKITRDTQNGPMTDEVTAKKSST
jgi:hypothetical protein